MVDCNKCSPKAIEAGYRASSHSIAEPSVVCYEAVDTAGSCMSHNQRVFDAVSRELFADKSALADGQYTFVLVENLLCELVRPTKC